MRMNYNHAKSIDKPCVLCDCYHPEIPKVIVQRMGAICEYCHPFVKAAEILLFNHNLRPMTALELRGYRGRKS